MTNVQKLPSYMNIYTICKTDLTTVSGNARIETIVDQVKWIVGDVARHKNKLKLPLDPNDTWAYNMKPKASSLKLCKGDFKVKNKSGKDITPNIVTPVSFSLVNVTINLANGTHVKGGAQAIFIFRIKTVRSISMRSVNLQFLNQWLT